jgi:diguanylate cyclase (GGDEF)-like protein
VSLLRLGFALLSCAAAVVAPVAAAAEDAGELIRKADDIKTADFPRFVELLKQLDETSVAMSAEQQAYIRYLKAWKTVYDRDYDAAIPELKAVVDESRDITLRFRADVTLTNAFALAGRYEEAYRRLNDVLELQPQVRDHSARMPGFAVASLLNNQAGQYDVAIGYADRWLAEESENGGICKAITLKAEALYRKGKIGNYDEEVRKGIAACEKSGESMFANEIRSYVGGFDVEQGRNEDAIKLLKGSYEEAQRTRYPLLLAAFDSILASAYFNIGDIAQARTFARRAIEESARNDVIRPIVDAYQVLYEVAKKEGDVQGALVYHEKYAAADKGYLSDTSARSLAYQMVNLQVLEEKRQIDVLSEKNQVLRLQGEVQSKAAETERLYVTLLIVGLVSIALWAYRTKRSQVKFQKLSRRDGLTGIVNRQHFMDEAKLALKYSAKSARDVSLVLIDLDHFKVVNDTHGHVAGDAVLKQTVAACQQYMRSVDLFGRLGGEEFGVLLPDCSMETARKRAEELRRAIAESVRAEPDIAVSASFGTTSTRESGYDLRQMLIHADSALYRAKRAGRNRVQVFEGEIALAAAPEV